MAHLRFAETNLLEPGSLAASPALVATLPEANLLDPRRAYVARTTGLATQTFTGDFSANTTLSFAVLWAHNLTDAATWRLRIYPAITQGGTALYDSTASATHAAGLFDRWPAGRRFSVDYFTQLTTARSWQIDITDAANPDGYMDFGELFFGDYTELGFNFDWAPELLEGDGSAYQRSRGGSGYRNNVAVVPWREIKLSLSHLSAAEAQAWGDISRNNSRFWVDMYPDNSDPVLARDHAMIAQLKTRQPRSRQRTLRHRLKATLAED
jgi:hypothetical protein